MSSPAASAPGSSTRRCSPVKRVRRASATTCGSPSRAATLAHGERGWATWSTASPMRQTSPIRASCSKMPTDVTFSPNAGSGSGPPVCSDQCA